MIKKIKQFINSYRLNRSCKNNGIIRQQSKFTPGSGVLEIPPGKICFGAYMSGAGGGFENGLRRFEFEGYMGEEKLQENMQKCGTGEIIDNLFPHHVVTGLHESKKYIREFEKISKWKVTMEELKND